MGNAETFGISRDKEKLKAFFVEEFSGSLSFEKYETINFDPPPYEPVSQLEEIEKYCNEIKNSKAWSLHPFPEILVETFCVCLKQGSPWSDFVPVVRVNFQFESQEEVRSIFESLTSPEKVRCWDDQRTDLIRIYKDSLVIEQYSVRFPFKNKKLQDFLGIKENHNGFEVTSFRSKQKTRNISNFFDVWKVRKVENKFLVQRMRHLDLGIKNSRKIEEIYAKMCFLNCRSFVDFVLNGC
jgi:hypothetical protein